MNRCDAHRWISWMTGGEAWSELGRLNFFCERRQGKTERPLESAAVHHHPLRTPGGQRDIVLRSVPRLIEPQPQPSGDRVGKISLAHPFLAPSIEDPWFRR